MTVLNDAAINVMSFCGCVHHFTLVEFLGVELLDYPGNLYLTLYEVAYLLVFPKQLSHFILPTTIQYTGICLLLATAQIGFLCL